MRKIDQNTLDAFNNNSNIVLSNTIVKDGKVYLHDNLIVKKINEDTIAINFCGWTTPTTSSRINTIVNDFTNGSIKVGISKGQPELRYENGYHQLIDSSEWITINNK